MNTDYSSDVTDAYMTYTDTDFITSDEIVDFLIDNYYGMTDGVQKPIAVEQKDWKSTGYSGVVGHVGITGYQSAPVDDVKEFSPKRNIFDRYLSNIDNIQVQSEEPYDDRLLMNYTDALRLVGETDGRPVFKILDYELFKKIKPELEKLGHILAVG